MKLPDIGAGRQAGREGGRDFHDHLGDLGISVLFRCAWLEAGLSITVHLSDFLVSAWRRSKYDNRVLWGCA
jgi:hypothetical protein